MENLEYHASTLNQDGVLWKQAICAPFEIFAEVIRCHLFTSDGRVVLFQRSDGSFIGPVSGGVDLNESYKEACLRELEEETGLGVLTRDQVIISDFSFFTTSPNDRNIKITVCYAFLSENFDDSALRLNEELSGYLICSLADGLEIVDAKGLPEAVFGLQSLLGIKPG
jgi:ADP-ribose pyrophosphatase YjhB (NUDIX family)